MDLANSATGWEIERESERFSAYRAATRVVRRTFRGKRIASLIVLKIESSNTRDIMCGQYVLYKPSLDNNKIKSAVGKHQQLRRTGFLFWSQVSCVQCVHSSLKFNLTSSKPRWYTYLAIDVLYELRSTTTRCRSFSTARGKRMDFEHFYFNFHVRPEQ